MLRQRVVTAAVLIPAFLAALFYASDEVWAGLVGLVTLVAWDEWLRLSGITRPMPRVLAHVVLICLGLILLVVRIPVSMVTAVGLAVWALIVVLALFMRSPIMNVRSIKLAIGCLVLVSTWWMLSWMQAQWMGAWWVLLGMCIVWFADIGAYFTGKSIGKTQLVPMKM